jgi:V8-like Glu-specific endopeptidase
MQQMSVGKKRLWAGVLILVSISSGRIAGAWDGKTEVAQSAQTANPVMISPEDKRVPIDRLDEKYKQLNAVGIFVQNNKLAGTGFLVDSCHVLTNAHVAYEELARDSTDHSPSPIDVDNLHLDKHKKMEFRVGISDKYPKGFRFKIEGKVIERGNPASDGFGGQNPNGDWAVVKLDSMLPADFPSIPIVQQSWKEVRNLPVISVGYPANRTNRGTDFSYLYGDLNCSIIAENSLTGYYSHDCQMTGGNSGGPLLKAEPNGFYRAVGMSSATLGDQTGLERPDTFKEGHYGVGFGQWANRKFESESDKILKAIKDSPCP